MRKDALAFLLCTCLLEAGCDEASPVAEAHAPPPSGAPAKKSAPKKELDKKQPDKPRVYSKVRFLWIRPQIGS
ncbi:MAG TPA: hypothetical protein VFB62_07370, partial [Polyangiaceae bacterium]|nr:hypothetical protein [Polyangiaceae bacterium]